MSEVKKRRPHRKKTLPVPGDIFIGSDGLMRIINLDGYTVEQSRKGFIYDGEEGVVLYEGVAFKTFSWGKLKEEYATTPENFIRKWERQGFYYLGNALTDEWENG